MQASTKGIEKTKAALKSRGWTQTTLTTDEEFVATWSTISKFFNGKSVSRTTFLEICRKLNLDWQEIVLLPDDRELEIETLPEFVKKEFYDPEKVIPANAGIQKICLDYKNGMLPISAAAREALNPRILERIDRAVVGEKYLKAIQRGLEGMQRIVPIIAPAGYGKSTILGNIYDELIKSKVNWVALVLCNSLTLSSTPSTDSLAAAIGEAASGTKTSILELASTLTNTIGRGVLLIDTLDLVIDRPFLTAFSNILRQLIASGTTVVIIFAIANIMIF